jgi:adenine-specific DNA-methyltransferase
MSQRYEKLKTLLQELFQLDQPDLDFGLYRVILLGTASAGGAVL